MYKVEHIPRIEVNDYGEASAILNFVGEIQLITIGLPNDPIPSNLMEIRILSSENEEIAHLKGIKETITIHPNTTGETIEQIRYPENRQLPHPFINAGDMRIKIVRANPHDVITFVKVVYKDG